MSACLAHNHDAHDSSDDKDKLPDVKPTGQLDDKEVYRILKMDPHNHQDEYYIQHRVRISAETALHFFLDTETDSRGVLPFEPSASSKHPWVSITQKNKNKAKVCRGICFRRCLPMSKHYIVTGTTFLTDTTSGTMMSL